MGYKKLLELKPSLLKRLPSSEKRIQCASIKKIQIFSVPVYLHINSQ